jgi:hypothetical protein
VREVRQKAGNQITVDQIIELHNHGIDPKLLDELRASGLKIE